MSARNSDVAGSPVLACDAMGRLTYASRPGGAHLCGDANRQTGVHARQINARALGQQTLHFQNGGQFLFGEQVSLAIEMGSFVRLLRHAVSEP